jgi:hypothetical protein
MQKIYKKTTIEFDGVRAVIHPNKDWDGIVVAFFDESNNQLTFIELDMEEMHAVIHEMNQMMVYVQARNVKGN